MKNSIDPTTPDSQSDAPATPNKNIEITNVIPQEPERSAKPEKEEPEGESKALKDCLALVAEAEAQRQKRLEKLQGEQEYLEAGVEKQTADDLEKAVRDLGRNEFLSSGIKITLYEIEKVRALVEKTEENFQKSIAEKTQTLNLPEEQVIAEFQKEIAPDIKAVLEIFFASLKKEEEEYLLDPNNQKELDRRLLVRQRFAQKPELQEKMAGDPRLRLILTGNHGTPPEVAPAQPTPPQSTETREAGDRQALPETAEAEIDGLEGKIGDTTKALQQTEKELSALREEKERSLNQKAALETEKTKLKDGAKATKRELDEAFSEFSKTAKPPESKEK